MIPQNKQKQVFFVNNKEPNLVIFHQNIQGIASKKEIIELTITDLKNKLSPDVLCFTEIFIKKGEEKNINIFNYELAAHYLRNKKRGGTCILIKKGISYRKNALCDDLAVNFHFECCSIQISICNIIVVCVYRTSTATKKRHLDYFFEKLQLLLNKYIHKYPKHKIIIVGDININTLVNNNVTGSLMDILKNFNLTQYIRDPTRGLSCIDHMFGNVRNATGLTLPLCLSDHDTAQVLITKIKKNL